MLWLVPLLLLLLATGLVLAVRMRRQERVVSSTLLWEQAIRDVRANAPWQRLRPNLLLLLQLLALAALVFALAVLLVFLVLAAQYESLVMPLAIIQNAMSAHRPLPVNR